MIHLWCAWFIHVSRTLHSCVTNSTYIPTCRDILYTNILWCWWFIRDVLIHLCHDLIQVSLQNTGLFCRALLQKRPIFLSILLIVATPYATHWVRDGPDVDSFVLCLMQHTDATWLIQNPFALQHTATIHCNTLQHCTVTRCNKHHSYRTHSRCNTLQHHTATYCNNTR